MHIILWMGLKMKKIKPFVKKFVLTISEAKYLLNATKNNGENIYDYRNYAIICLKN